MNVGKLAFNKFEFPFQGKTIAVVGRCIPTTTSVLPLNEVNSNVPNNNYQTFTHKFYCSIQKIKFLLGSV